MKKVYLDSSFLVSYQIKNHPFHQKAKNKLKKLSEDDVLFCLSPLAIDEYLYALNKYLNRNYIKNKNQIKISLKNILQLKPSFIQINWLSETPLEIYDLMAQYSLRPRDAFHLKTMDDHQINYLATFDQDFNNLFEENIIKKI
jgi:predicted nucleic acid-binding protein